MFVSFYSPGRKSQLLHILQMLRTAYSHSSTPSLPAFPFPIVACVKYLIVVWTASPVIIILSTSVCLTGRSCSYFSAVCFQIFDSFLQDDEVLRCHYTFWRQVLYPVLAWQETHFSRCVTGLVTHFTMLPNSRIFDIDNIQPLRMFFYVPSFGILCQEFLTTPRWWKFLWMVRVKSQSSFFFSIWNFCKTIHYNKYSTPQRITVRSGDHPPIHPSVQVFLIYFVSLICMSVVTPILDNLGYYSFIALFLSNSRTYCF